MNYKPRIFMLGFVCFFIHPLLMGCTQSQSNSTEADPTWIDKSGKFSFVLNQDVLQANNEKALLGDAASARRLAAHYGFGMHDQESRKYWLLIAAENDDVNSMRVTAQIMRDEGGGGCYRAIFWLDRAHKLAPRTGEDNASDIEADLAKAKEGLSACLKKTSNGEDVAPQAEVMTNKASDN